MRWLSCICLLLSAVLAAGTFHRKDEAFRIDVATQTVEETNLISRYASNCALQVNRLFGLEGVPRRRISIAQGGSPDVLYDPNQDALLFAQKVAYACLKRAAEEFLPEGKREAVATLSFLADAVAFRQMRMKLPSLYHFGPAQIQLEGGFLPSPALLLSAPAQPESPALFHLQCMYSDLLLACLDASKRDNARHFRLLVEMEADGRAPRESADFVLASVLPQGLTADGWFRAQASNVLRNHRRTLSSEAIEQQVRELQMVSIAKLDTPDTVTTIPLEKAPEAFRDFQLDLDALARLQGRFLGLVPQSPPLLQESIAEFANAVGVLIERRSSAFRKRLSAAQKQFRAALERQREVENALDEFAAGHTNVILSVQSLMEIIRRYDLLSEELLAGE